MSNTTLGKILLLLIGCTLLILISLPYEWQRSRFDISPQRHDEIKYTIDNKRKMVEIYFQSSKQSSGGESTFPTRFQWNASLCSARATARGPGQSVIAYSYYGPLAEKRGYYWGIEVNAKDSPLFYPGWVMRVYHDVPEGDVRRRTFEYWQSSFPHLDFCDTRKLPVGDFSGGQKNAWRFVALADPLVEVMVSRDLDSRLSARETAAVAEWLGSPFSFHVMRDSKHHKAMMLAGMWGAKISLEPQLVNNITKKLLQEMRMKGRNGKDQDLLLKYVWPEIKGHVMQHDSFYCFKVTIRQHGGVTPFPTKRLNTTSNYVGAILIDNDAVVKDCPAECRPPAHKDWLRC